MALSPGRLNQADPQPAAGTAPAKPLKLLGTSLRAFRPAHWLLQKVTLFPAAAWFETTNAPARRNAKVMLATLAEAA